MRSYLDLMAKALAKGEDTVDRTGVGTMALIGESLKFDLSKGLPLVTTKKVHMKSVIAELLWFISGSTNVRPLQEQGVSIWDEWADASGDLGPIYGQQWRAWEGPDGPIDQLALVIEGIKREPTSRRHIVNSWNVAAIDEMALPPCHMFYQFHCTAEALSTTVYMRSADIFLGLPFNIASYAVLTHMVGHVVGRAPRTLHIAIGDAHLYKTHRDAAVTQLARVPLGRPSFSIDPDAPREIDAIRAEHMQLTGYESYPHIPAPIAV